MLPGTVKDHFNNDSVLSELAVILLLPHEIWRISHPDLRPWRFGLVATIGADQNSSCHNFITLGQHFFKMCTSRPEII